MTCSRFGIPHVLACALSLSIHPIAQAHDLAQGGKPAHHFHIKGRITSTTGQPLAGVELMLTGRLIDMPPNCVKSGDNPGGGWISQESKRVTDQNGNYELIYVVELKELPECQQAFDSAVFDRNRIVPRKEALHVQIGESAHSGGAPSHTARCEGVAAAILWNKAPSNAA